MIAVGSLRLKIKRLFKLSMTRNVLTCVNSQRICEISGESLKIYLLGKCFWTESYCTVTESVILVLNHRHENRPKRVTKTSKSHESSDYLSETDDSGMNFSIPTCSDTLHFSVVCVNPFFFFQISNMLKLI